MDIYKEWERLNQEKFQSSNIKKEEIMKAISKESALTIHELKKRLKYKIYWVALFLVAFTVWLLLSLQYLAVLPFIGVLILFYALAGISLWRQYQKMDDYIDPEMDTLTTMKHNAALIKKALKAEKVMGMFMFPAALICGLVVPLLYSGTTLTEIMNKPVVMAILLGCMVVLVPLLSLLGDKMNDMAYGDFIKKLDENIGKMEHLA